MNVTAESLAEQISQYINELTDLTQHLRNKNQRLPNIKLLQHKINIKLAHFQTALQHLHSHQRPTASLKQLSQHLAGTFSQIVKEAHRLLKVNPGEEGENRLRNKLTVLRELQNEMNQDWQRGFRPKNQGILRRIDDKTSMLAVDIDPAQLRSLAKEYLEKEFLAIRMVAYKMYQQYTAHHHNKYNQHIRQLYQEQEQLSRQVAEAAETNKDLKAEEKRLVRQLNELRTTNELISKRYFESGSAQKGE